MILPLHIAEAHKAQPDPACIARLGLDSIEEIENFDDLIFEVLTSVLTAKQPLQKRSDVFQSKIGKMYGEFRYRLVLNLVLNARSAWNKYPGAFGMHSSSQEGGDLTSVLSAAPVQTLPCPDWLEKGVHLRVTVASVREILENTATGSASSSLRNSRSKKRRFSTDEISAAGDTSAEHEDSIAIISNVYSLVNSFMTKTRESCRRLFLRMLCFLCVLDVCGTATPRSENAPLNIFETIPSTTPRDKGPNNNHAVDRNVSAYRDFVENRTEMWYTIGYDVTIVPEKTIARVTTQISLLDVSTAFLIELTKQESKSSFLSCSSYALDCICLVSLCFRRVLDRYCGKNISFKVRNQRTNGISLNCAEGRLLRLLLPQTEQTWVKQVESTVLLLTQQEYDTLCCVGPSTARTTATSPPLVADMQGDILPLFN